MKIIKSNETENDDLKEIENKLIKDVRIHFICLIFKEFKIVNKYNYSFL